MKFYRFNTKIVGIFILICFIIMMNPIAVNAQDADSDYNKIQQELLSAIRTPKTPDTPRINGPSIFGVRPGHPFLYTIPAAGIRPMTFSVDGLPDGLQVNPQTGKITGQLNHPGTTVVTLRAENTKGSAEKEFRIVAGEDIALTPPLGWNSWNCWGPMVDAEKVLASAKAMVSSGLINHGWTYINIDDAWQAAERGGSFQAIQGNEKFPDMKGLCDEVHDMGLKIGIYSTPCVQSYAGYIGGSADTPEGAWTKRSRDERNANLAPEQDSIFTADIPPEKMPALSAAAGKTTRGPSIMGRYTFAMNDAKQWAAWGFDYMKYDWNPNQLEETREMSEALRNCGRDIIYSLSNSMPYENISELRGLIQCWRTTGDIRDDWYRLCEIGFSQNRWTLYASPGHWNDPDMLVVGYVDVGKGINLHPSRLTPDEQYTHITLWSLLSSPLLIGCDMECLDPFTLNLLTNDEVLAVNQDALGKQATQVSVYGDSITLVRPNRTNQKRTYLPQQVWARDLEDGSKAVGLFNLNDEEKTVTVKWTDLGITGKQTVRDLWRQKDLGVFEGQFELPVTGHGAEMMRIVPIQK